jgi:hypothetical protein
MINGTYAKQLLAKQFKRRRPNAHRKNCCRPSGQRGVAIILANDEPDLNPFQLGLSTTAVFTRLGNADIVECGAGKAEAEDMRSPKEIALRSSGAAE